MCNIIDMLLMQLRPAMHRLLRGSSIFYVSSISPKPLQRASYELTASICDSDEAYFSFTASPDIGFPCFIVGTARELFGMLGLIVMFKEDIMF